MGTSPRRSSCPTITVLALCCASNGPPLAAQEQRGPTYIQPPRLFATIEFIEASVVDRC